MTRKLFVLHRKKGMYSFGIVGKTLRQRVGNERHQKSKPNKYKSPALAQLDPEKYLSQRNQMIVNFLMGATGLDYKLENDKKYHLF